MFSQDSPGQTDGKSEMGNIWKIVAFPRLLGKELQSEEKRKGLHPWKKQCGLLQNMPFSPFKCLHFYRFYMDINPFEI